MKFTPLPLSGAFLIEQERHCDERGFFVRLYDEVQMENHGLNANFIEWSSAFNIQSGTLRGLHYQEAPYQEAKLVHCVQGQIFDVIVDIRPLSPTFQQVYTLILSGKESAMLYIPEGFAHGYQTMTNNVCVHYYISKPYVREFARGIRFDDPSLGISWPLQVSCMSARDQSFPCVTNE